MRRRLNFRCRQCRTITMATAEWKEGAAVAIVACTTCGLDFSLTADRDRGATNNAYRELIRGLASTYGVDVSTANSLFEDMMSFEEAMAFQRRPSAASAPAAAELPRKGPSWFVVGGIAGIVLLAILMFRSRGPSEEPAGTASLLQPTAPVTASVPERAPEPAPRTSPVVYWTDVGGRLSEVTGTDPRSVLEGYCNHPQIAGSMVPAEVRAATPPNPGLREGVLRDLTRPGHKWTVALRRDPRTGRWYLGDRHGEIRLESLGFDPTDASVRESSEGGRADAAAGMRQR